MVRMMYELTVTVLDAQGKEISNSPEVTLKLVAGPGEFPTGTSITFKQDSDIRIQDGKAAIAFRSYYAGKTLIEASSPGLVPARVELVFEGAPQYVPNVTPQVRELRMFVTLQPIGNVRCRLSDVIIRLLPTVSLKVCGCIGCRWKCGYLVAGCERGCFALLVT